MSAEAGRWSRGCCLAGGQLSSPGCHLAHGRFGARQGPGKAPKTKTWRFPLRREELQPGADIALLPGHPQGRGGDREDADELLRIF